MSTNTNIKPSKEGLNPKEIQEEKNITIQQENVIKEEAPKAQEKRLEKDLNTVKQVETKTVSPQFKPTPIPSKTEEIPMSKESKAAPPLESDGKGLEETATPSPWQKFINIFHQDDQENLKTEEKKEAHTESVEAVNKEVPEKMEDITAESDEERNKGENESSQSIEGQNPEKKL